MQSKHPENEAHFLNPSVENKSEVNKAPISDYTLRSNEDLGELDTL